MALAKYGEGGLFAPRKIADVLRTSSDDVARTLGLGRDALQRKDRVGSDKTQRRLREMIELLNKVEPRFGSALIAYAWYRSEPLAGFPGKRRCSWSRMGGRRKCSTTSMRWTRASTLERWHRVSGQALSRA